ncbi:hypothetical protein ACH5RR_006942 [Cinchona calisaya]|uniref:Serine-rich protein-like protein n=1 Tax=Cinchona calisaya TaxID=153742 RepID=A0ABD3AQS5_9GENT
MAASTWRSRQPVLRSLSSAGARFCSSNTPPFSSPSSPSLGTSAGSFSSPLHRSASLSPTHVNSYTPAPSAEFVTSPLPTPNRTCMCSPSTNPGSFRCSLHRKYSSSSSIRAQTATRTTSNSSRLNMRRLALMNSLSRCREVNGNWVKSALATLALRSSHQQGCHKDFRPRPSRLSVMSKAEDS